MIKLKILAPPSMKFFGDFHAFRKWDKQIREAGIDVEILYDHNSQKLLNADRLMLHHRYFDSGWVNALKTAQDKNGKFVNYLKSLKNDVGKLIWFDADDSSGTTQFPIISYVDVFVKKQVLKDKSYYTGNADVPKNLMVWSDQQAEQKQFIPCPHDEIHKIRVGWNLAFDDYRDFRVHYKIRKFLSHFINYKIFPLKYTSASSSRALDATFRGKVNYATTHKVVSFQRNKVLEMFASMPYKIASGGGLTRNKYLAELSNSKVSISPFGFGEVCYRDFETFISGALLVKPSMDHLVTFPDLFIPHETYVPVSWDMSDLSETLGNIIDNHSSYQQIATNGQESYRRAIDNPDVFINAIQRIIN